MNKKDFLRGLKLGLPVCIGYFSVSFGFGTMAIAQGLSVFEAILISATNLTSAGQFAGLTVITSCASIIEMILTQLVINSRYALMSLALGQRLGEKTGYFPRFITAFFNTDEVFALGMSQGKNLNASFFTGVGVISATGWTFGTAAGACAGTLLPASVSEALGVMLYGMFIAIVVPQAKKEKPIFACVLMALAFSSLFFYLPQLKLISTGLAIVICTIAAAALCALFFPVNEEESA